ACEFEMMAGGGGSGAAEEFVPRRTWSLAGCEVVSLQQLALPSGGPAERFCPALLRPLERRARCKFCPCMRLLPSRGLRRRSAEVPLPPPAAPPGGICLA